MPRPGIVDADLISFCKGVIDAQFGPVPAGLDSGTVEGYRLKLATCIAAAAQYARDNNIVNIGQTVAPGTFLDSLGHPITGEGVVDSTGTFS